MTKHISSADSAAWQSALEEYYAAREAWGCHVPRKNPSESDTIHERYMLAEDSLLATAAPDLDAVIRKLEIIWEDELDVVTPDSYSMMAVIGDMRRLLAERP